MCELLGATLPLSAVRRRGGRGEDRIRSCRRKLTHTSPLHAPALWPHAKGLPVKPSCAQTPPLAGIVLHRGCNKTVQSFLILIFFTPLEDIICLTPEPSGKAGRHTACCLDALLSSAVLVWKMKCHSPTAATVRSPEPERLSQPSTLLWLLPGLLAASPGREALPGQISSGWLAWFGFIRLIFQLRGLKSLDTLWMGESDS